MASSRFLFSNGVVLHSSDTPSVSTLLETHSGAYTTTRTHNNGTCLLFWERHLQRLTNSARIVFNLSHQLTKWESKMGFLVNDSVNKLLPLALKERRRGGDDGEEELAVTTLVVVNGGGLEEKLNDVDVDVYMHVGTYVPPLFGVSGNGASLALVGRGRDVAAAKYSDWVRLRKQLEKLRPPSVTELLLSNDGDQILEGCVTNFFVVCRKDNNKVEGKYLHDYRSTCSFEVQTAPISDGVLPGIIRQLVIEVCLSKGIPVHEVAPSWSKHELWEEAFITNSLRVIQHVDTVQVPSSWESLESKLWNEVSWKEKRFMEGPGMITKVIQKEIMERAGLEGYQLSNLI